MASDNLYTQGTFIYKSFGEFGIRLSAKSEAVQTASPQKAIGIYIILVVVSLGACIYFNPRGTGEGQGGRETQVWWMASDPHVGYGTINCLEVGVEDVNEYVEKIEGIEVDYAIQLGDLIHESSWYRGRFLRPMDNLNVENWYYILGNHDFENPPWDENLLPPVDTILNVMGMKWILISDHLGDTSDSPPETKGGNMPEDVREWVVEEILYSEEPVFVFSHQPPTQWTVWTEEIQDFVVGSGLRAWFYGHIHAWSAYWYENQTLIFSDCSLDWSNNYMGVFMFLEREDDTVNVTLRFRDHKNHEWIETPLAGENVANISFSVEVA